MASDDTPTPDLADLLTNTADWLDAVRHQDRGADVRAAADRLRELERWKAEAILVLDELDRTWELLGRPGVLGSSKVEAVGVEIAARLARLAILESAGDSQVEVEGLVSRFVAEADRIDAHHARQVDDALRLVEVRTDQLRRTRGHPLERRSLGEAEHQLRVAERSRENDSWPADLRRAAALIGGGR